MIRRLALFLILLGVAHSAHADWVRHNTNTFAWFKDVFFVNERKGWIVGTDGIIISTKDGGATWVQERKFTNDTLIQVHFTSETDGWLLCERNIYTRGPNPTSYLRRTTDGGHTWEVANFESAGRERVTKLLFQADGRGTAFGEGGIFYRLQPDGVWKKSRTAVQYLLLDGAFVDDSVGAIVGTGGTIVFTEDGGFTWERATLLGEANTRFNAVFFDSSKSGWAVGTSGRIFRSNRGGRLWRQQFSGVSANLNDIYFNTPTSGWAVGDRGVIVRTRDGGSTWFDVPSRTTHRLEKIIFSGGRGWAVGFGGTVMTYEDTLPKSDRSTKPVLMKRG